MLPSNFKPQGAYALERLGARHDGGYLVDPNSVRDAKLILSFGISDDWSFEADFLKRNDVKLIAFDPTISSRKFGKRFFNSIARLVAIFWRPHVAIRNFLIDWKVFFGYFTFFRGNRQHISKYIGYSGALSMTFDEVWSHYADQQPVFVKCDIEGWEYRILDDLARHATQFSGLIVEFHDVDLQQERIEKFVRECPLTLVHTHANNFSGLDNRGDPVVLEMTFARNPQRTGDAIALPHPADTPNDPQTPEIALRFAS